MLSRLHSSKMAIGLGTTETRDFESSYCSSLVANGLIEFAARDDNCAKAWRLRPQGYKLTDHHERSARASHDELPIIARLTLLHRAFDNLT